MKKILKDNLILILISFLPFVTVPAIVNAQQIQNNLSPFLQTLSLTRGNFLPGSTESFILSKQEYCDVMINDWGWSSCDGFETVIIGYNGTIDTLLIEEPTNNGFVKFDDWNSNDKDDEIKQIEKQLNKSLVAQAKATNSNIKFLGWQSYPTLDQNNNTMFYATKILWDGEEIINIKATKFDRRGYITFRIVPIDSNLNSNQIRDLVTNALTNYKSKPQQSYASFVTGDKVAAVGAIGVLATLVGVKYGKAAATGIMVLLLAFLKKGGVILLLPLLWIGGIIKRMFSRNH